MLTSLCENWEIDRSLWSRLGIGAATEGSGQQIIQVRKRLVVGSALLHNRISGTFTDSLRSSAIGSRCTL
jgi:hypothetical protein